MKLFTQMTGAQYAGARKFFAGKGAQDIATKFTTYIANAVDRAMTTGDVQHLNALCQGAANFGRYRMTRRAIAFVEKVWKYDTKAKAFTGKANSKALKTMRANVKHGDGEAPRWETLLEKAFAREDQAAEAARSTEFDYDKYLKVVVAKVHKEIESVGNVDQFARDLTRTYHEKYGEEEAAA